MKNTSINKYNNLEFLRLIAALGIVWFHTSDAPGRDVAYAGLPVFLLMSVTLLSMKPDVESWQLYLKKRSSRLLIPWLFWSFFYLAIKLLRGFQGNQHFLESLNLGMVLGGTHVHLWYFTFCFLASLIVFFLVRLTKSWRIQLVILIAVACGCTVLWLHGIVTQHFKPSFPWGQWFYSLATIPIGFAIGRSYLIGEKAKQRQSLIIIVLPVIMVCILLASVGNYATAVSYSVGITLFTSALVLPDLKISQISKFSPLTLGIYVLHPFIQDILFKFSQDNIPSVIRVILVFVGSCTVTLVCKHIPWIKKFV